MEILDMFFGDNEDMDGCFGVEVVKGEKIFVLMYGIVGYLFVDDLAENAHIFILVFDYYNTQKSRQIPLL
jgi:hypothetical protein